MEESEGEIVNLSFCNGVAAVAPALKTRIKETKLRLGNISSIHKEGIMEDPSALAVSPIPDVTSADNGANCDEVEVKIEIDDDDAEEEVNYENCELTNGDVENLVKVNNCEEVEDKIEIGDEVEEEVNVENCEQTNDDLEEQVTVDSCDEVEVKIEIKDDLEEGLNVENCEGVEVKIELNNDVEEQVEVKSVNPFREDESKVKQQQAVRGKNKGLYKKENSEYVCCSCNSRYKSISGMNNHFNTMVCGFGTKTEKKVKRSYLGLYSSEGSQFQCTGCMKKYNSIRGVHRHLETHDECGLRTIPLNDEMKSVKKKPVPTKNFKDLYIKQDGQFICLACEAYYQSIKGIHHHLNKKSCWLDKQKSLKELYMKDGTKYFCSKCSSEFNNYFGVWRHLKICSKE